MSLPAGQKTSIWIIGCNGAAVNSRDYFAAHAPNGRIDNRWMATIDPLRINLPKGVFGRVRAEEDREYFLGKYRYPTLR